MVWKDILKMPVSFDAEQQRDVNWKQKIIDYEKKEIEPVFNEFIQSQGPEHRFKELGIGFNNKPEDTENMPKAAGVTQQDYRIGNNTVNELGGNRKFILNTLAEIYKQEGWDVENHSTHILIKNKR